MGKEIKENFMNEVQKTINKGEHKGKFAAKTFIVEWTNPIEAKIFYEGYAFCMVGNNLF
jgi:hypothetical protein